MNNKKQGVHMEDANGNIGSPTLGFVQGFFQGIMHQVLTGE